MLYRVWDIVPSWRDRGKKRFIDPREHTFPRFCRDHGAWGTSFDLQRLKAGGGFESRRDVAARVAVSHEIRGAGFPGAVGKMRNSTRQAKTGKTIKADLRHFIGIKTSMILVIDDDSNLRRAFVLALKKSGFDVLEAGDGAEGLKLMGSHAIDLVLTDVLMPNTDGVELIQIIRRRFPKTAIVAMSGGGVMEAEDCLFMAKKLGAAQVLRKPFDLAELVRVLTEVLDQPKAPNTQQHVS